jgi:hypothetical protein
VFFDSRRMFSMPAMSRSTSIGLASVRCTPTTAAK